MSRTPQFIGNAKRQGTSQNAGMAVPIGADDVTGGQEEIFTAIAGQAIAFGEVLVRTTSDARVVGLANANVPQLSFPCGVALEAATIGFPVRVMRRGIHSGVRMTNAGAAGNQMSVATTAGACDFNAYNLAVAVGLVIGIQMEAATGSPLRCSAWVDCKCP